MYEETVVSVVSHRPDMWSAGAASSPAVILARAGDPGENITVSDGDPGPVAVVFAGDAEAATLYQMQAAPSVSSSDASDLVQAVNRLDYHVCAILFFLAASWTVHHIRNAVRSFTGRGVDV